MKYKVNLKHLLPLTLMLIALSVSWHIGYLQSSAIDTGKLVYRRMAGTEEQLVGLTPFTQYMISDYDPRCSAISRTGIFIVTPTLDRTDLIVYRFSTGEVIRQFSPLSTWAICSPRWLDDTTVRFPLDSTQVGVQEYVDLNVYTGSISPYVEAGYTPPTYPQLPSRIESQPVFEAPNGSFFLYERCLGTRTATTSDGEVLCVDNKDWVVYNPNSQQVVATITRPGHVYLHFAPYESVHYAAPIGIAWSPDSRFLASVTGFSHIQFPFQLIDTMTGQVTDLDYITVDVDVAEQGMFWSPDSQKLAFWVKADVNDIESDSPNKTLVFYNTLTGTFTHAALTINPYNAMQNGQWAPDGSVFAYIDENSNLVHVDAATGATNILDNNIVHIELWAPLIAPLANAGYDQAVTDSDNNGTELVTLNSSGSTDSDGTIVSYSWSTNGVVLATGVSPQVNLSVGVHALTLTVTDDDGATGVDIVVITVNAGPTLTPTPTPSLVANAGPDQSHVIYVEACQIAPCRTPVIGPISVTLDGSNSTGAITAYEWTRSGQVVSTQASFTTYLSPGSHVFTLKVSNTSGYATDSVTVLVSTCDPNSCTAIMSSTSAPEQ